MYHFTHCHTKPTPLCYSLPVIHFGTPCHFSIHHSHLLLLLLLLLLQHAFAVFSFHLSTNPLLDITTTTSVSAEPTANRRRLSFHSPLAHLVTQPALPLLLLLPPPTTPLPQRERNLW
ncbi:hypothetical protein EmuJ_000049800 [Echinococcus multilocularis]|uniref:Uncharacterized protein n=1 Tax=Echinococcus multilocularis TaxID=6211 RepID=A0A087VXB6_ECHMU|nr:hypothetical protein EmuJ_000049800 [Echinococcus multilocularis]